MISRSQSRLLALVPPVLLSAWFGGHIVTYSVDFTLHHALVYDIMLHGKDRSPAGGPIGVMLDYPPLSHWVAATIGWIGGNGIVAINLLMIVTTYVSYYYAGRILAFRSSPAPLIVFVGLFSILMNTGALLGWEIVRNGFFPQLFATAMYFALLWWAMKEADRPLHVAIGIALATPFVYWTQPLPGMHMTAAFSCYFLLDAIADRWRGRPVDWRRWAAIALVVGAAGVFVTFDPTFRAMMRNANHNGGLGFFFWTGTFVPAVGLGFAFAAWNAIWSLRNEARHDLLLASAGLVAAGLLASQYLALAVLGIGSDYSVKKHLFLAITFGALNASRALGRIVRWRAMPGVYQGLAAIVGATAATIVVFNRHGIEAAPIVSALRFAEDFARTSSHFKPGNTSAALATAAPGSMNYLLSLSALQVPIALANQGLGGGDIPFGDYVIMEGQFDCSISNNSRFSVLSRSCMDAGIVGKRIEFTAGSIGRLYLSGGWHPPDHLGTWVAGRGSVAFKLPKRDYKIVVEANAFVPPARPVVDIQVDVNGAKADLWRYTQAQETKLLHVSAEMITSPVTTITFESLSPPMSGLLAGTVYDARIVALSLVSITIQPAP